MIGKEELRSALKEAIAAGIAARKSRTRALLEEARQKGRGQEDISGWSWLEVDFETFRDIMLLGMAGVRVTCRLRQPGYVAEDTQLHLDAVGDYQRYWASMAGMEAAARVLQRHGITAKARGMVEEGKAKLGTEGVSGRLPSTRAFSPKSGVEA